MKFTTKAIHVGQVPDEVTGAIIPPIYQTSTYRQGAPAVHKGYDYTRAGNPNFTHLEHAIAALEQAACGVVFSSGLGATTAVLSQLKTGDHVLAIDDVYGGTFRLLKELSDHFGIAVDYVSDEGVSAWEKKVKSSTKVFWLETPTNPLLTIADIQAVATLGKKRGVLTVVDNTFASPALQTPLTLGADVVVHSTTKYIGGHSDVVGGALATNDTSLAAKYARARLVYGLNPSPFDAWLTHRGLKTLGIRMERHCSNALAVAKFLENQKGVKRVFYPGLSSHAGHALAKRQMCGFGGMVSVDFDCTVEKLKSSLGKMEIFALAESLGGVESLVCHPATMTHASVPADIRKKRGITDTLVRFSVGIEDIDDLLSDLDHFLKKIV